MQLQTSIYALFLFTALAATDPATCQVRLLRDIGPGSLPAFGKDTPVVSTGSHVYFVPQLEAARELWVTDGSPAGTRRLRGFEEPQDITAVGTRLYFSATETSTGRELWVTDGSDAGTRRVTDLSRGPTDSIHEIYAAHRGMLFFAAYSTVKNRRQMSFWRSDGSAVGTIRLAKRAFGTTSQRGRWKSVSLGEHLYFHSYKAREPGELWRTDGSARGTRLVYRLSAPWTSIRPEIAWKGRVWCSVVAPAAEIWTSDGSTAGTKRFRGGHVEETSWIPSEDGDLYFAFAPSGVGRADQLWRTDGSLAGTRVVSKQVFPAHGVGGSGNRILFAGKSSAQPQRSAELYSSDGSSLGTKRVSTQVQLAPASGIARVGHGSLVAFQGIQGKAQSLWLSDGSATGTRPAIHPSRIPDLQLKTWGLARAGEHFVVPFWSRKTGSEAHSVPLRWFGAAFLEAYGDGCRGSLGTPMLRGRGGPPVLGNARFTLELSNARKASYVGFAFSKTRAARKLAPCTLHVPIASPLLVRKTDAQSVTRLPLSIPNFTSLIDTDVYWQALVLDPGGELQKRFALSNGLRTLIGR